MIKFREHRGSLEESMKTCINVRSSSDILNIINDGFLYTKEIKFTYQCFDERIGWDTYMVMGKYNKVWYPVGYTNGTFEELRDNKIKQILK